MKETDKHVQEPIQATDEIVKAGEDSVAPAPEIPVEPAVAAAEPAKEETKPVSNTFSLSITISHSLSG